MAPSIIKPQILPAKPFYLPNKVRQYKLWSYNQWIPRTFQPVLKAKNTVCCGINPMGLNRHVATEFPAYCDQFIMSGIQTFHIYCVLWKCPAFEKCCYVWVHSGNLGFKWFRGRYIYSCFLIYFLIRLF